MDTATAVGEFVDYCMYRGLASSTLRAYQWGLARLANGCAVLPPQPKELLRVLGDRTLAHESRRDLARILGRFFRWARRTYKLRNPLQDLDPIPKKRLLPRILQESEINALLGACSCRRDHALVLLPLDTGARLGEIAALRWEHVGPDYLRVDGKTGPRHVPPSAGSGHSLSAQVHRALLGLGDGHHIWTGPKGPLTVSGIRQVYERLFYRAGIAGRKNGPHCLRHTFGTWYIRGGGNVVHLQHIMGHADLKTTMIYVHLAGRDVAGDHRRHSPIATLGLAEFAS